MIPELKSKDSSRQIFALPSMHKTGHVKTLAEAKEIAICATSSDGCSAEDVRTRKQVRKQVRRDHATITSPNDSPNQPLFLICWLYIAKKRIIIKSAKNQVFFWGDFQ